MEARLIRGGSYADARGCLRFCNDFDMREVKRFYTISNSVAEPKRGWIMHKKETKWFFPLNGITRIYVEDAAPSKCGLANSCDEVPTCYTLNAATPAVLCIPPEKWFMIEQESTAEVQVFSSSRLGEYANDDFRKSLT